MTFNEAVEYIFEESADVAEITRSLFNFFNKNFAVRFKNGLGYSVASNPSQGIIAIGQEGSMNKFSHYDVGSAIRRGLHIDDMVSEINDIMEKLSKDPETQPLMSTGQQQYFQRHSSGR